MVLWVKYAQAMDDVRDFHGKKRKGVNAMVKEYIEEQKQKIERNIEEKQEELKKAQETEKIICGKLDKIRESDLNFEIFSPRIGEISLREKIKLLEEELKKTVTERMVLEESISELEKEKKNFEEMLKELEKLIRNQRFKR